MQFTTMQGSCFQAAPPAQYQTSLYRPTDMFDSAMKLPHSPELGDAFSSCLGMSRAPPSYSESTMICAASPPLQPIPNSSTSYYKLGGGGGWNDFNVFGTNSPVLADQKQSYYADSKPVSGIQGYGSEVSVEQTHILSNPAPPEMKTEDCKHETSTADEQNSVADDTPQVTSTEKNGGDIASSAVVSNEGNAGNAEEEALQSLDKPEEKTKEQPSDQKPPLSYIALIAKSILESAEKRLSLGSIYNWIEKHFPYFKNRGQGWRNSVRHNLSLNDCFIKAGRCEDGKGNYWSIHPANLQDFMRGDFRQRRRSRRRGRKKDCEFAMHNGYMGGPGAPLSPSVSFNPAAALSSIYSPYTEAERRAYRLDEVLLRQSMNNPFMKWYHNGVNNTGYSNTCSLNNAPPPPPPSCNSGMYNPPPPCNNQWQTPSYADTNSQSLYPLGSSFSRFVK
ncbi:fork head domain transcription factor slp1-like [Lingula anatina]|uniref:Fork head domain transcription factor slp1-like n=1 Tax=Lingula anatina TaxID=7574 RepID=A0A1S3IAI6_LINAN|nr:fork head domain transcription factor slp1-like [Lingula anatina]|eukprot:XP_013395178.1 fork head domain transcription factor slp1-like [Lingula anatina]